MLSADSLRGNRVKRHEEADLLVLSKILRPGLSPQGWLTLENSSAWGGSEL
jgi:hypothetical protein